MINFTIMRHGQTKGNVAKLVQSRSHGELTETGVLMAESLGELLKDEELSHIFCSDLKRCHDTAKHLAGKLKIKTPIYPLTILREKDLGDFEHQSYQLVLDKRDQLGIPHHKSYQVDPPKGESYQRCKKRAGTFFSEIVKMLDDKYTLNRNILVVSHGNFICCLFEYLLENPAKFRLINFTEHSLKNRNGNTARTTFKIFRETDRLPGDCKIRLEFSHIFDVTHLKNIDQKNL